MIGRDPLSAEETMDQTEQILLQAIQKTLWNNDYIFPDDTDWDAVLQEAERQSVLGVAAAAVPAEKQREWINKTTLFTAHFIRILHCQSALCDLLKANGIPTVILKGTAAAVYYPTPSQRSLGDIDFIVPQDLFDQAEVLLANNGYSVEDDPKYPRHVDVRKDGISFEMHRFFSDRDCRANVDPFIFSGMQHAETGTLYHTAFPMLPPKENGLVLLAHIAHHLREGLGLRQIIDWMLYVDRELDDSAWESSFRTAAEQTGLAVLAITVTEMCRMYLGLSDRITWCKNADKELCTMLMNSLLSSGNFGKKRGTGLKVESTVSRLKRRGFRYLQQAGEHNWNAYHKHRWLKPFAWIYQIGRYARQGFQAKRKGAKIIEDIGRGKKRSDLYQDLKIGEPKE